MADELDGLLARVDDSALRADLCTHIDRIRAKRTFGLVFESHLPERVRLPEHPMRAGAKVALRDNTNSAAYQVLRIRDGKATVRKVRHPDGSTLSADGSSGQSSASERSQRSGPSLTSSAASARAVGRARSGCGR